MRRNVKRLRCTTAPRLKIFAPASHVMTGIMPAGGAVARSARYARRTVRHRHARYWRAALRRQCYERVTLCCIRPRVATVFTRLPRR